VCVCVCVCVCVFVGTDLDELLYVSCLSVEHFEVNSGGDFPH